MKLWFISATDVTVVNTTVKFITDSGAPSSFYYRKLHQDPVLTYGYLVEEDGGILTIQIGNIPSGTVFHERWEDEPGQLEYMLQKAPDGAVILIPEGLMRRVKLAATQCGIEYEYHHYYGQMTTNGRVYNH